MKRLAIAISIVAVSSLTFAMPVMAAAPSNDTYAGRTVIGSLPFSESIDTSEATTDSTDAEMNPPECGAPATDASVWYEVTASADSSLVVNVAASTYSAGVSVATGSPGSFTFVACGPGAVAFGAIDGETYTILVFDDQFDGTGNGGTLAISVEEAPPTPQIDVTVDRSGTFNRVTGSATITGTVTCDASAEFAFIDVQLTQTVGRFIVSGFGESEIVCDGTTQPWSVEVFGSSGLFKGGRALSVTTAVACGLFDCGFDFEETSVKLRG
jgi:hypothetical protein